MQHFDIFNGLANARNNNIYFTMYLTLYIPWIFWKLELRTIVR